MFEAAIIVVFGLIWIELMFAHAPDVMDFLTAVDPDVDKKDGPE